jgi:hypothetical protein
MSGKADPEKYPVSEEEMGKKYKIWTESLARYVVWLYSIGKEVGGDKFVEKVKDKYYSEGLKSAKGLMAMTGTSPEDFQDCANIHKIWDIIDESAANYWNGYVENSPRAFEKELFTCPGAKAYSKEPEICSLCITSWCNGVVKGLNPRLEMKFSKLMPEGDDVCRYRVEMKE